MARYNRNRRGNGLGSILMIGGVALIFVVILAVMFGGTIYANGNDHNVTITVEDKERVTDGDTSKYLVFTDKGTFENTDSLFEGKHNSSDVYGKLKRGKTYDCHVQGHRHPWLSMYENIISCDPA